MAELMDKQGILDELRRRSGGAQQEQTPMMDKQQILDYLRQRSSAQQQGTGTFAPVKQDKTAKDFVSHLKAPQESQGWFQKGAFEDGYQYGDASKAILGTGQDIKQNAVTGAVGIGEKALDFLAFIAPFLAAASPWNESAVSAPAVHLQAQKQQLESAKDLSSDFIKKDLYDEEKVAKALTSLSPTAQVLKAWDTDAEEASVLGQKSDAVVQSLGQMAATAAMGGTVPWWVVTGASSFGGEAENALKQGATMEQAGLSAAVSAGAEILTEKLFGGSGLGEKGFINLDKLTKGVSNKLVKTLLDYGVDMAAEGAEEVVSSVASNLASALYREENLAEILFSEEALQEYVDSFISGAAVGGMMNVGKVGSSIANKTDYRNGLTAQEQKVFDTEYNAAIADAQKNGTLTKEKKAEIYDSVLEDVISRRPAPQQAATPTQSEETVQSEKVTTTQAAQTAQTPSQPMTPQQAMQEAIAEIIGVPSVTQAVESFRQNGKVSNSQAEAIIADDGVFREILEMTGIAPPSTKSESRAAVKQAVAKLAQESVDNTPTGDYDMITNQGGVTNGESKVSGADATGLPGGTGAAWIRGADDGAISVAGRAPGGMEEGGGLGAQSVAGRPGSRSSEVQLRVPPVLRVSSNLKAARVNSGIQGYDLYDTTSDPHSYEKALTEGRNSDAANGWCVTPKSTQELVDENVRTFMNESRTVGVGVKPDGDIVAVFKNQNGGPKRALDTAMPMAIEMGGDRLDCYGEGLVRTYENYGFIPVARVEFNSKYANEGWTPDKGTPYIYFMVHNGDSADVVTEKIRTYNHATAEELAALPTFGKEAYDDAMAYRDNFIAQRKSQPANPNDSVGAAPAGFSGDGVYEEMKSRYVTNTMANATDESFRNSGKAALKADPDLGTYYKSKEKDSLRFAQARTQTPEMVEQEYNYLMENGINSAEDVDTAKIVQTKLFESGDPRFVNMARLTRGTGTQSGQIIQAFAKYTRMTGEDAAAEVVTEMDKLKESDVPKRFYQDGGFEQWKGDVITSSMNIAKQIDSVEDGDVDGMKDIIRSMAKWRKTTAWFGLSSDLSKAAEAAMKDIDFETAKAIANAQLSTLPSDFKKRPVGQVVKTIRIHNMLSALTTINRNLVGNTAVGFIDATSDSTSGRFIDALVSKVTGKRTVGNDIKYGKTYMDAAWKATKMASLCAELDIPMDSESRFTTGTTRTYSPQGNPIMRFMSAYEKYMKYALEVTDQFYQGGANAAVEASLQEISGNETLTQEEAEAIAKLAGQRRTLKDERAATRMAKKLRQGLNEAGTENIGLGDLTMPFATIGSTSAHVAIDYTAGSVTGLAQVFQLMSDVKKGRYVNGVKTIYKNGKAVRTVTLAEAQRAAVTNAGRGITGLGLVTVFAGLAAAGILKAHDDKDKDKRGLEQAQNLSGAQLNIDAAIRGLQGKSTDWQNDDLVISVDFLEPFNAQMYLGYLLSQDESVLDAVKSYPKHAIRSVVSSIADMPPMQGMQEALDILSGLKDVGEEEESLAQWATDSAGQVIGSTASGFIPGWLRQLAQVIDPYYRDTSGDTATDAALNQVKAAIPGLSQTLPKKYSGLGQEQLRDDDWISGIFNTMVNPGDADRIKTTEVTDFLDELYDLTGDLGIYPDAAAPKSFTQDKKTYTISTKEETETYQKTYGSEVNKLYSEIIKSADFKSLDETDQAAVLEKAKEAARALAKSKISGKYTPPSSIKNKPIYKSDAQAILDAYLEAKRKAEKEAQKEAFKESYWANKNGQ